MIAEVVAIRNHTVRNVNEQIPQPHWFERVGLGHVGSFLICAVASGISMFLRFFPQDICFLSSIPAHTNLGDLLTICTTAVALCLLAALVPAWFAARVDPAVALRDGG